ncbi:hypothetical protein R1sor_004868 [Riccia sorocarpa]|uniref:Uncharacterized protein n=1 Tax=Riccia sorocarpa TaxID=122646 RepID=A0ABD3HI75_9MARC
MFTVLDILLGFASSRDGLTRTRGAGGRGIRERDDRGKHPMVDPNPICEPVEETFEKGELAPIIMVQPTTPSRQVKAGEGSSAQKKKKKKSVNRESYETSRSMTENNYHIRHAWFKRFAENVEHTDTFKKYNTSGTSMGVRRFVEHLCELDRQKYEVRREIIRTYPHSTKR